ncbi:MAG: hypothetical protein ABI220_02860 [Candidatus Saccharimonadales bacterium]
MVTRKESFTDERDYNTARLQDLVADLGPIDPQLAYLCRGNRIAPVGELNSSFVGACAISGCTLRSDKEAGVTGFCLKVIVGVAESQD